MRYIKDFYNENDYKDILNHFINLFVNENFLNLSNKDFKYLIQIRNDIIKDILKGNIKSDKKLFSRLQNDLLILINHNESIKNEIERHKIYKFSFKSDLYIINNILNYDFFRLSFKDNL